MIDRDQHQVIHDAAILGVALTMGVVAAALTGSPLIAALSFLAAVGIGAALIGCMPTRRVINNGIMAMTRKETDR